MASSLWLFTTFGARHPALTWTLPCADRGTNNRHLPLNGTAVATRACVTGEIQHGRIRCVSATLSGDCAPRQPPGSTPRSSRLPPRPDPFGYSPRSGGIPQWNTSAFVSAKRQRPDPGDGVHRMKLVNQRPERTKLRVLYQELREKGIQGPGELIPRHQQRLHERSCRCETSRRSLLPPGGNIDTSLARNPQSPLSGGPVSNPLDTARIAFRC